MKFITWFKFISLSLLASSVLCGCSNDSSADEQTQKNGQALYLRGEMNDYSVSETYRLKSSEQGLCTEAALHADWSPYHFKFADAKWSSGSNFGYAFPPGSLEEGSRDLKLNPNSRFEDVLLRINSDGVYRFCLIKKDDGYYARVSKLARGDEKSFDDAMKGK